MLPHIMIVALSCNFFFASFAPGLLHRSYFVKGHSSLYANELLKELLKTLKLIKTYLSFFVVVDNTECLS